MTQHIKTFLSPYIQTKDHWKLTLLQNWEKCMGSLAKRVVIEKIYDDVIVLGVPDSCWLQELYLLSPTLLKTINQSLDSPRIKEIRFKQTGRAAQNSPQAHAIPTAQPLQPLTIRLSSTEQETLSRITDLELRNALKQFLIRCYQEKKR